MPLEEDSEKSSIWEKIVVGLEFSAALMFFVTSSLTLV